MIQVRLVAAIVFIWMCFEHVEAACGPGNPCNPQKAKPCPDCYFCKKDGKGNFVCHYVNKGNVKNLEDLKAIIRNFEAVTLMKVDVDPNPDVYDPTIGFGFSLERDDAKAMFKKVLGINAEDFDKILNGEKAITIEQARKLFDNDIDNIYVPRTKRLIGEECYNSVSFNVKAALVNAFFRGDIGPKTIALIKQKKWSEACVEYLNHDGYKNAAKNNLRGLIKRMDCNVKQFCPPPVKKCEKK